jgi:hypothetical protein
MGIRDSGDRRSRVVDDYSGYTAYDERGGKIGKVDYTVLGGDDRPAYIGVNTGFFGMKTTLIPADLVRLGSRSEELEVHTSEDRVKDAPTVDDAGEITPEFEDRVRDHFGLRTSAPEESPREETASSAAAAGAAERGRDRPDYEDRERRSEDRPATDEERRDHRSEPREPVGADRPLDRDRDRETGSRPESGDGEKIRVTLKRERAYAERVRGADGQEEVRIRKEMVEEEELVEVVDRLND